MPYTPPTFAALAAELRDSDEITVVARHLIESHSQADLVALLSDGLRLQRQSANLAQTLSAALAVTVGVAPDATPAPLTEGKAPLLRRAAV